MTRLTVFLAVVIAVICSAAAQSCDCNALSQCATQNRKAKNDARASCESGCTSQLTGGVNGQAVLQCFSQKRAAKDTAEAAKDSCMFLQANICSGGGGIGRKKREKGNGGRGGGHSGGRGGENAPELQQFKQCVRTCMQGKQLGSGSAETCLSQGGCSVSKDTIRAAKRQCHGDRTQGQNVKQQLCQCLVAAGVKSLTCNAAPGG